MTSVATTLNRSVEIKGRLAVTVILKNHQGTLDKRRISRVTYRKLRGTSRSSSELSIPLVKPKAKTI